MDLISERMEMALSRMEEIRSQVEVDPAFARYFAGGAEWFLLVRDEYIRVNGCPLASRKAPGTGPAADAAGECRQAGTADEAQEDRSAGTAQNGAEEGPGALYEEILPDNYAHSYANYQYAVSELGREFGPLLCALRCEMRSVIPLIPRAQRERILIRMELFLEIYAAFAIPFREDRTRPLPEHIRMRIISYIEDYAEEEYAAQIPGSAADDLRRSRIGALCSPVSSPEEESRWAGMPQARIEEMAGRIAGTLIRDVRESGWTSPEGLLIGIDSRVPCPALAESLSGKLEAAHLTPFFYDNTPSLMAAVMPGKLCPGPCGSGQARRGAGKTPEDERKAEGYEADHRDDLGLFLDDRLCAALTRAMRSACSRSAAQIRRLACTACITAEGTEPGVPQKDADPVSAFSVDKRYRRLLSAYREAEKKERQEIIGVNRYCISVVFSLNYNCCEDIKYL